MRAAALAVALLACAALVNGQDFRYPKTVVLTAVYNSTTLQSDPITVDEISAAPWSKRSWNKTPRPASLTSFQVVVVYKPAGPVANCTIETPNNTAFTCTFNGGIVAAPLVVQYVAATSDNNTAVGYAIIKPVFVKPGRKFGPQPVFNGTHPWFGHKPEFNGTHPWFNGQKPEFNGTHPWFNGTHPEFNGTYPWFNGQKPEFNGSFPWFGDKTFNRTFHHHRRHNKTLLGH